MISAAATFSSRCATFDVPGIGNITGDRFSNHASASCPADAWWSAAMRCSGLSGGAEWAAAQREPRDETDALAGGELQQRFGATRRQVVHVLHRHDLGYLPRGLELIDVNLGQADVADLAFVLERKQFAHLIGQRKVRVDAVQLEQVDGLDAQAPQAHLEFLAQVARIAQRDPDVGTGPQQTSLGRDHQPDQ